MPDKPKIDNSKPRSARDAGIAAAIAVAIEISPAESSEKKVNPQHEDSRWNVSTRAQGGAIRSKHHMNRGWGQSSGWRHKR